MKAIALGIPVLVSDTPEQERIVRELGLPDSVLVRDGEDWDARIAAIRDDYPAFEQLFADARTRIIDAYSDVAVTRRWFARVMEARRQKPLHLAEAGLPGPAVSSTGAGASDPLRNVAVAIVDIDTPGLPMTIERSKLDWKRFESVTAFTVHRPGDMLGWAPDLEFVYASNDFFSAFTALDEMAATSEAEWLLIVRAGNVLGPVFARKVAESVDADDGRVASVFATADYFSASRQNMLGSQPLVDLFTTVCSLGALLVSRRWFVETGIQWREELSLTTWRMLVQAFATGQRVHCEALPYTHRGVSDVGDMVTRGYARWAAKHDPIRSVELPDWKNQWQRFIQDVIANAAGSCASIMPAVVGELYKSRIELSERVKKLESTKPK